jgi:hypothetical protein
MSLSPLKVFQRFKELFAGRSPSIAAAIREAEKRQPAAAFKPPVTKVIGPGGIELTRKHKPISAYKDENGQYNGIATFTQIGSSRGCRLCRRLHTAQGER